MEQLVEQLAGADGNIIFPDGRNFINYQVAQVTPDEFEREGNVKHKHPGSMIQDLQDALAKIARRTQWHPETLQEAVNRNNWITNYAMRWFRCETGGLEE